jgi:sterol desaturase/sphingolipid hydroxylase (fatty acid hydroxylase superfamily)
LESIRIGLKLSEKFYIKFNLINEKDRKNIFIRVFDGIVGFEEENNMDTSYLIGLRDFIVSNGLFGSFVFGIIYYILILLVSVGISLVIIRNKKDIVSIYRKKSEDKKFLEKTKIFLTGDKQGSINSSIVTFIIFPIAVYLAVPVGLAKFNFVEFNFMNGVVNGICAMFLGDALLYFWHRFLHSPFLLKHIHYKHHEIIAPKAFLDAASSHPFELVINLASFIVPLFLFEVHFFTVTWVVICEVVFSSLQHIGVDFSIPLFFDSKDHDRHHSNPELGNYGFFSVMDKIFGTWPGVSHNGGKRS